MLHNELILLKNEVLKYYADQASQNNNTYEILITEPDMKQYSKTLLYRKAFNDWGYRQP